MSSVFRSPTPFRPCFDAVKLPYCIPGLLLGLALSAPASGASTAALEAEVSALAAQNARLMQMLEAQQAQLARLQERLASMDASQQAQGAQLAALEDEVDSTLPALPSRPRGGLADRVQLSGEFGFAFYLGQENSLFPENDFRVDEARLFVEAEIGRGVYLFTEIELAAREPSLFTGESVRMGEVYAEFEALGRLLGRDGGPTLRAGRIDIPFGIEYLERDVMANPFISHTLADPWGIDEGIAIFGEVGPVRYIGAVQNGGISRLRDFNADKSLALRLSYTPVQGLDLHLSAMRTGDLSATADIGSEIWIANGIFILLGGAGTTTFHADLAQLDVRYGWKGGHFGGALGAARYDDNDPNQDNARDLLFYSVEGVQTLAGPLYGALRYSAIDAGTKGYPLPGHANRENYFFNGYMTSKLEHFTIGLGYRASDNLVLKTEYTWEWGDGVDGLERSGTDIFATEIGVRF